MGSHPLNLTLRFLLELAALGAMGVWGYGNAQGGARYALALAVPLLAACAWGVFAVPGDPSRSGRAPVPVPGLVRLLIELAFFGFALWALWRQAHPRLALAFGALCLLHYLTAYDRVAWLLRSWLVVLACLGASACAGGRPPHKAEPPNPWEGRGRECVRAFLGKASPYAESAARSVDDPLLLALPLEARRTACAAGLEALIAAALRHARDAEAQPLELLQLKQALGLRLISLETQLAAIIFESECTGELIEAMAFELDQKRQNRGVVLAVGSLVVGAVLATAAGIWDLTGTESKGPAVLGLTAGLGSAALGAAAFAPPASHLRYRHERNLLVPVLRNDDRDELFPAFVFRLLTLPAAPGRVAPREQLVAAWKEAIEASVPPDERAQAEQLLYGEGGEYSEELLALRERMYDALETQLNSLARDLELLDRFLVQELATPVGL